MAFLFLIPAFSKLFQRLPTVVKNQPENPYNKRQLQPNEK
jgi:hypothetical protein